MSHDNTMPHHRIMYAASVNYSMSSYDLHLFDEPISDEA